MDDGATLPAYLLYGFLLFIPASLLVSKAAELIVNRIPEASFRKVVGGFPFLLALQIPVVPWPPNAASGCPAPAQSGLHGEDRFWVK